MVDLHGQLEDTSMEDYQIQEEEDNKDLYHGNKSSDETSVITDKQHICSHCEDEAEHSEPDHKPDLQDLCSTWEQPTSTELFCFTRRRTLQFIDDSTSDWTKRSLSGLPPRVLDMDFDGATIHFQYRLIQKSLGYPLKHRDRSIETAGFDLRGISLEFLEPDNKGFEEQ